MPSWSNNEAFWIACAAVVLVLLSALVRCALRLSRVSAENLRLNGEVSSLLAEAAGLRTHLAERTERLSVSEAALEGTRAEILGAARDKAALDARLTAERLAAAEKEELLRRSERQLREAFGSLSAEALRRNNETFLVLAKTQFGEFQKVAGAELDSRRQAVESLVRPIGESLGKMGTALEKAERERIEAYGKVMEQAGAMGREQLRLAAETGKLARALHASGSRGRWGELQLRRVVEMAGMLDHCDFEEQRDVAGGDDSRLRPDMVVRLAGGRTVVVDAKAPMDAYLRAHEAETPELAAEWMPVHAKQTRAHMLKLGSKAYWGQFPDTPEYVVMFLPSESVFSEALRADAGLLEFGTANKVIPASPLTLIALLRAVAHGWQQARVAENAKFIFELGRELHGRFAKEFEHVFGIGKALGRAVEQYNQAIGSVEHKLLPSLRKFGELTESGMFPEPEHIDKAVRSLPAGETA